MFGFQADYIYNIQTDLRLLVNFHRNHVKAVAEIN